MSVHAAAQADPRSFSSRYRALDLSRRLRALPLPVQVMLNGLLALLLMLDVAIPDVIPLLDEALLGWLLWTGTSAFVSAARRKRQARLEDRLRAALEHPVVGEPQEVASAPA